MSSFPNVLNSYGEDIMNLRGFTPIQMQQESNMVRSVFITSDDDTNHHGLFSSSHAFRSYQDHPHVSSSSFGYNNSHMAYQMRPNMVSTFQMPCTTQISNVADYFPINDNLSQVSITQTITNRYSAIVPTNSLITSQNDYEWTMTPKVWNPSFNTPNFVEKQCEILNPTPLNTIYPHQNSVFPRHLDLFSSPLKHQHVSHHRPAKKRCKPTKCFENVCDDFDSNEEDGRTHSLPYEKYGPYTCPKCNSVFDTSQKFAAHVSAIHYKNETIKERIKRYNARNKKRSRKACQMINGESQKIQPEDKVVEEIGDHNNIVRGIEAFQHPLIVKEEPLFDLV